MSDCVVWSSGTLFMCAGSVVDKVPQLHSVYSELLDYNPTHELQASEYFYADIILVA